MPTDVAAKTWYCLACGRRCVATTAVAILDPLTAFALCNCSDKDRPFRYVMATLHKAKAEQIIETRVHLRTTLRALRKRHAGKALSRAEAVALAARVY